MKRNFLFCFLFVSMFFNWSAFAISGDAKFIVTEIDEKLSAKLLTDEKVTSEDVRSIKQSIANVEFNKTVFGGENLFYLGSNADLPLGVQQYAISKTQLVVDPNTGQIIVDFVPITPEIIVVNNEIDGKKEPLRSSNPLYGKEIENLNLNDQKFIVANINREPTEINKKPQVCLVRSDVTALFTHKVDKEIVDINDASGSDEASSIVNLASCSGAIIAAVIPKNKIVFGETDSGFAVLVNKSSDQKDNSETRLSIVNAINGVIDGNKALEMDLNAGEMIAITQDAKISGLGDMFWDSTLQRLFVVLTGAEKETVGVDGGAISILVGRLEDNKLILEHAVDLDSTYFENNQLGDNVVGFYSTDGVQYYASGYKVRTMHTSTGFSYLIINGGKEIGTEGTRKRMVYALPIVKSNNDKSKIGKLAQKEDFTEIIDAAGQLVDVAIVDDEKQAGVGLKQLPLDINSEKVEDMFIVGDSVYAALAGNRSSINNEAGIFKSTALFDEKGKIFAWTEWERVMGSTDKVFGFGIDSALNANSGNYWYLTNNIYGNKTTVKVTQWGHGESFAGMLGQRLVSFLSTEFTHEIGGVHQIFNFDEFTPGFEDGKFSMMIATGYKKIVLLETGKYDGSVFNPTQDFSDPTKYNVFENNNVLNSIGPVCCSETSRIVDDENKGWIFVGGYNGLAVLSKDDGDGWDTNFGLDNVQFDDFSFKKIGNLSHIRKLVCDGNNKLLYIVTDESIYKVEMNKTNFSSAGSPDVVGTKVLDTKDLPDSNDGDFISDFLICGNLAFVTTISGLFKTININASPIIWQEVKIDSGVIGVGEVSIAPVQSLSFIPVETGGYTNEGNLYVLSADFGLDLATVYRFQIKENEDIYRIKEDDDRRYFYQIGEFRCNFLTDGSFCYHLLSKHFGLMGFLKKFNNGSKVSNFRTTERIIDLGVEASLAYNVGLMAKDSATGAWVVPGDWGIRVQE